MIFVYDGYVVESNYSIIDVHVGNDLWNKYIKKIRI